MIFHLVTDDAFLELCIIREKAEAALKSIMGESKCRRAQTLADIANDYLSAMDKTIQAMQENRFRVPLC